MKRAAVTGAGSGVGRAIALELARRGWSVALLGRREAALRETVSLAGAAGNDLSVYPCDIGVSDQVEAAAKKILAAEARMDLLVNAAGTNTPNRSWQSLSVADYQELVNTNLNGAFYCTRAFLPVMRRQQAGTIINIVSDAGKQASPKAGVAYVASKFGLAGLTQSLNAEERQNGIRACAIFPGDIDTPILDRRPQPPPAEARARMLQSEDVAQCALLVIGLPARALVEEIVIRPR